MMIMVNIYNAFQKGDVMRNRVKQFLLFLLLSAILIRETAIPVCGFAMAAVPPDTVVTVNGGKKRAFTDSKEKITFNKKTEGEKQERNSWRSREKNSAFAAENQVEKESADRTKAQPEKGTTAIPGNRPEEGTTEIAEGRPEEGTTEIAEGRPEEGTTAIPGNRPEEGTTEVAEGRPEEGTTAISGNRPEEGTTAIPGNRSEESTAAAPGKPEKVTGDDSAAEFLPQKTPVPNLGREARVNHSLPMPKSTYETFILQGKKGKGQRIGDSKKVSVFPSNAAIQEDITKNHREYVSFTPHWSADTTASLSTQAHSRSVKFYVDDPKKAEHVGGIGKPTMSSNVVGGRVFVLNDAMKNSLSCTFSNVGRYYDRSTGKSCAIDLKAVLVNFTRKNKASSDVQTAIKDGAIGEEGGPLFCFTGKQGIGVLTAFCDSVVVRYEYYVHGTQTPVNLKGFARFSDLDAQQGIEFSSQADYFYAVSETNQYLGYSKGVYTPGNRAYIYALSSKAYPGGEEGHGFYTLFSGTNLTLRYTFAKCSREDDGGKKNGNDLTKYAVPFDPSEVKHYTSSASRGYIRFDARQPYLAEPEISKSVFNGKDIQSELNAPNRAVSNTLSDRNESYTYKIRTICPYEDAKEHHYPQWVIRDQISPYLEVDQAEIYDGTGKKSTEFILACQKQGDGSTLVTATAKNPAAQEFYEKNWYDLYITVRIKSADELQRQNLNFAQIYRKSGEDTGKYILENNAVLHVGKEYPSNKTKTVVPQWIKVKKINENNEPVQGITFGIFLKQGEDAYEQKPLLTAISGKDGIAHFKSTTFFALAGKAGPYYLKELSRGNWENVYVSDRQWKQEFSCDEGNRMIEGEVLDGQSSVLKNKSKKVRKYAVRVRKKNKETADFLSGAVFGIYQWSETGKAFMKAGELAETKDERGQVLYHNDREFTATEENKGLFMVKEEKAPFGCYHTGESWTFQTTDRYEENQDTIEFYAVTDNGRKKKQTGELVFENKLQKGILEIQKTNELEEPVGQAVFTITAAEDIYAPWQRMEEGKPMEGEEPLVAAGTICDTLKTDQQGKAFSRKLFLGKYQVAEIDGTPGHNKTDAIYEVTFAYPEDGQKKLVSKQLKADNHRILPSFSVAKIADRTTNKEGNPVAFDRDSGRYTQEKIPGTYQPSDIIRYGITVTNTGNVDLYHLRLTEQMDMVNEHQQKLSDYIDQEKAGFVLPESGYCKTTKGKNVRCIQVTGDGQTIGLDQLSPGDSLTVYFEAPVLSSGVNVYHLRNKVVGRAGYDRHDEKPGEKLIPVNTKDLVDEQGHSLVEDEDLVNLPGVPGDTVVKKADRTTGCTVDHGVLQGVKVPGIYNEGEEICFSIHVKNSGTANLKNILVTDLMSSELKQVTEEKTAGFCLKPSEEVQESEGEKRMVFTDQGKKISVRKVSDHQLLLGEDGDGITGEGTLQPGDSVILDYRVKIKKNVANVYHLVNTVIINACYFTGEEEKALPEISDTDEIELPGVPEVRVAKIADRTTGAVLTKGRYTGEKAAGRYANGNPVVYTITVTNTGSADLYDLKIREKMEERLISALEMDSIQWQGGRYKTKKGNTVLATQKGKKALLLDQLKAGDSVDLLLHGKVSQMAGDLYALENKVYVTGHYRKGNEDSQKDYDQFAYAAQIKYNLYYHANQGTTARTQDSESPAYAGKRVKINGNPFIKKDADFLGWNTKADGTGKDYAPGAELIMPESDVHLYARWTKRGTLLKKQYTYALLYHANTPSVQQKPDSETRCLGGTSITVDENSFDHPEYRFLGWSLTPEEKEKLIRPGETYRMPEMDVHFYAQWEKIKRFTLVYHDNIPDGGEKYKDYQTPCAAGTKLKIKQALFERPDYQFVGWSRDKQAQKPEFLPEDVIALEENMQLYAIWVKKEDGEEKIKYTMYYHGNNERADMGADSQTPCAAGNKILLDMNAFVYEGHRFSGWNTRPDGTGKDWGENQAYTMPAKNVHLYAKWQEDTENTLIYDANYPETVSGKQKEQVIDAETPCTKETVIHVDGSAFRCDGYTFLGWSLTPDGSSALILPEERLTMVSDVTLYAIWTEQCMEYTLLYSSNTENPLWEAAPQSPMPAGTPQKIMHNPFTRKEAVFVGWSTNPQAVPESEEIIMPGTWFRQPDKNIILYAIWKKQINYPLLYDANGGSRDEEISIEDNLMKEGRIADEETPCIAGDKIRINLSPFKRKGYRFIGWSTQPLEPLELKTKDNQNTEHSSVQDQVEQLPPEVKMTYPGCSYIMPEKEVILYALWEKLPEQPAWEGDTEDDGALADSAYTPIPVTKLMMDQDHIHIPGKPDLRIAKKAERTRGITLKEGRYQGKRKPGVYMKGEHVLYTITVSNYGTGTAYDVIIREKPTNTWKKSMEAAGFSLQEGEVLQTVKGASVLVKKAEKHAVTFDHLSAGDRLAFTFEAIVKQDKVKKRELKNIIEITGREKEGAILEKNKNMQDMDMIKIKTEEYEKDQQKSTGDIPQTGDNHPVAFRIFTGFISLLCISYLLFGKKKDKKEKRKNTEQ